MNHGNYANGDATNGHDGILDQITKNDTVHAAKDGIKHGEEREHNAVKMRYVTGTNMKRNVRLYKIPGNKNFDEFSKSDKAVSQKTKATNERKGYDNRV